MMASLLSKDNKNNKDKDLSQGGDQPFSTEKDLHLQTYSYFYQLIWQPATWLHHEWWRTLALDSWQPVYQSNPYCRRWINAAIAARRGFPTRSVRYSLTSVECKLINLAKRLPSLLLALGLLRLGQPEYWMLKPYRLALKNSFDHTACAQLAVLVASSAPAGFHIQAPLFEPMQVADIAQGQGMALLSGALPDSVALRALEILFAPQILNREDKDIDIDVDVEETVATFGLNLLFRLARFL